MNHHVFLFLATSDAKSDRNSPVALTKRTADTPTKEGTYIQQILGECCENNVHV